MMIFRCGCRRGSQHHPADSASQHGLKREGGGEGGEGRGGQGPGEMMIIIIVMISIK